MREIKLEPKQGGATLKIHDGLYTRFEYLTDNELAKIVAEISKYFEKSS
jgi:hypothetical protein